MILTFIGASQYTECIFRISDKMEIGLFVVYASVLIPLLFYIYLKQYYSYWKRRNVPGEEPHLILGNMKGAMKDEGIYEIYNKIYKKFKGKAPFTGYFQLLRKAILPLDLDLIKNILVRDFNCFPNRGLYYNDRDDPLSGHLFFLENDKWRSLRAILSPTFTSGKIKFMFSTVIGISESLVEAMLERIEKNPKVNIKDLLMKFTTDVIGVCAFGIECNTLKNENNEFLEMGASIFKTNIVHGLRVFSENFPNLARYMHIRRMPKDISSFYFNIVKQTITMRQKETTRRKDFMDNLINLLENSTLSLEEIAAQSFVFLTAGFETSSTTMDFALYELACNQTIQDKLRQEIYVVIDKHKGKLSYEGINEMTYLKKVVSETLRKHSVVPQLRRIAVVDYRTGDPSYIIPKGTLVTVPITAIHNDPEYYPNPEVFDPERFSPQEIEKRHPMAYLPFGEGPRHCIADRFGKMQVNIGLIMLIRHFKFSVTQETLMPLRYSKTGAMLSPLRPIILKVQLV